MWARLWAPLLALTAILAGCGEAVTSEPAATPAPPAATPEPAEPTKPKRQATCDDSAIRLLDREAGVHGAIVDDTLHMGGATAPATCTDPTNESLHAGPSVPDGRTEQVRQSQYYLIVIRYPDGNRLYVISRRGDGTLCVVDTNDQCIAHVTALPDDYDVEDLPEDVPPEIPAGRPAPPTVSPPPASGAPPGRPSNPQPRDEATGVTVPVLSWAATPLALSYDVYLGITKELTADTYLGTPINTSSTFLWIPPSDLADDTTYYWRVDAKNDAGSTRGDVWSFTTGEPPPPLPTATASSGRNAGNALDGDDATLWCATSVPAWFRLDLGEIRSVSRLNVHVFIVASYTVRGNVETSADGSSWTSVSSFHATVNEPRTFTIGRRIRYVRINFTETDHPDSHTYKGCIAEVSTSDSALPKNVAGIYEGTTTFRRHTVAETNSVREEVKVRDRYNVFQTTGADEVVYYGTILEVLPGDDNLLRDLVMRNKGVPWSSAGVELGLVCTLSLDGTCRLCNLGHNPDACDQRLANITSITFKGNRLSHTLFKFATISGTYTKVDDDPGPFQTPPPEVIDPEARPGTPPAPTATASSFARYAGYSASPDQAIDGDDDTFWCAARVPAWFKLDLGWSSSVGWLNVDVFYHTVHGNFEISADGSSWTKVSSFDTTASDTGSGIDDSAYKQFAVARRIRYVRINFTQTDAPSSNVYQACISEVSADEVPQ